ncbi:unnamed protein product [Urochloa humidicola]
MTKVSRSPRKAKVANPFQILFLPMCFTLLNRGEGWTAASSRRGTSSLTGDGEGGSSSLDRPQLCSSPTSLMSSRVPPSTASLRRGSSSPGRHQIELQQHQILATRLCPPGGLSLATAWSAALAWI